MERVRLVRLADGPLTPWESAGHLLGPALLALAALSAPSPRPPAPVDAGEREWLHLLLPYVPVTATGVPTARIGR